MYQWLIFVIWVYTYTLYGRPHISRGQLYIIIRRMKGGTVVITKKWYDILQWSMAKGIKQNPFLKTKAEIMSLRENLSCSSCSIFCFDMIRTDVGKKSYSTNENSFDMCSNLCYGRSKVYRHLGLPLHSTQSV